MVRRITIALDATLLSRAKRLGPQTGRSLSAVIADALRETLTRSAEAPRRGPALPVSLRSGSTLPGVNLDCSADLLDLMERP